MITVGILAKIRRMYFREKVPLREIARRTGLSRNTVRRWLRQTDGLREKSLERRNDTVARRPESRCAHEHDRSRGRQGILTRSHPGRGSAFQIRDCTCARSTERSSPDNQENARGRYSHFHDRTGGVSGTPHRGLECMARSQSPYSLRGGDGDPISAQGIFLNRLLSRSNAFHGIRNRRCNIFCTPIVRHFFEEMVRCLP